MTRILIGVTGNIAGGKSLVARRFQEKGCALIDADKVAHELYASNRTLVQQLAAEFGPEMVLPGGILDRRRLGARVFGDPEAMRALDRLVHPHLLVAVRERIFSASRVMTRVVLDAALIVEWGSQREMDHLVLVTSPEPLRLQRLMERDGLTEAEAGRRMGSQMSEAEKRPFADHEIANTGSVAELMQRSDTVWQALEQTWGE